MKKKLKIFSYIVIASIIIQMVLIIYKHYTGYVLMTGIDHFIFSLMRGVFVTSLVLSIVLAVDLKIIRTFNTWISWQHLRWLRMAIEPVVVVSAGMLFGILFTLISLLLFGYRQPLEEVFRYNALITAVLNLILVSVLEAILFYKQSQESRLKTEILERENIGMRFETLKKQLDPHFLFNSLNVLSSLIQKDRKKAQEFIDEFSHVYRYTLEVIDKPVVTVEQEMDYAQSYLFLQKIRFGSAVMIEVDIDEQNRDKLLPPLAVQILLENAFKHNIATESNPLQIRIYTRNDQLIVVNSRQKRQGVGKGMGFENLKNRYNLITNRLPEVMMTQDEYIVKIPILEAE